MKTYASSENLEALSEEEWCRLLDIFQSLRDDDYVTDNRSDARDIGYGMAKSRKVMDDLGGGEEVRCYATSIGIVGNKSIDDDCSLYLQVVWAENSVDVAKSCFGPLYQHLGVEWPEDAKSE